jgi:hypothetical protein
MDGAFGAAFHVRLKRIQMRKLCAFGDRRLGALPDRGARDAGACGAGSDEARQGWRAGPRDRHRYEQADGGIEQHVRATDEDRIEALVKVPGYSLAKFEPVLAQNTVNGISKLGGTCRGFDFVRDYQRVHIFRRDR